MKSAFFKSITASALILSTLIACSIPERNNADNNNQILAAWVVLGDQGQATARVITTAATCPVLQQDSVKEKMHVRALPATEAPRRTSSAASLSKPSAFPVLTCELPLMPGIATASVAGKNLPLPKPVPLKILVLGDNGCRLKSSGNYFQACNDIEQWPFSTVAKTAANFVPDLVVHVGDYHYRENPCPENNAGCADSPWGFGWDTWQADFFAPAAPLLAAAPWVMVRGNHEICRRAGQGWWRFLDPRALQSGRDCNLEVNDMQGDYSEPYTVPLGAGAQLIIVDSAKAPDKALAKDNPAYPIYLNQFRTADQLALQTDFSIFLIHHPVLGFYSGRSKANRVEIEPGNAGMQSVLQDIHPNRLFADDVHMVLSGDAHLFEAITFKSDHPTQFVVGNGGSSPDLNFQAVLPPHTTPFVKAQVAHFNSTNRSGFMTMERAAATSTDWVIKAWDKDGALMTTCFISRIKKECS